MTTKPFALPVNPDRIPVTLKNAEQWLIWKHSFHNKRQKWIKLPLNARTGHSASATNKADLSDFDTAYKAMQSMRADGVGYVFNGCGVIGIDYDDKAASGKYLDPLSSLTDEAKKRIAETPGFWEVSPSGKGLHCFTRATLDKAHKNDSIGIELYGCDRFFCVTGIVVPGSLPDIPDNAVSLNAVLSLFPAPQQKPPQPGESTDLLLPPPAATPGLNFFRNVNEAALQGLSSWVPALFNEYTEAGHGGYRVTSNSLGRSLEEDISIAPSGIVDFGVHDMGDAREGKRTPIDLVMEWYSLNVGKGDVMSTPDAMEAAVWLCKQLQVPPETLGYQSKETVITDLLPKGLKLDSDEDGFFFASKENIHKALSAPEFHGVQIAYDAFRDEIVVRRKQLQVWRAFTDADYWNTCRALESRRFQPIRYEHMRLAVNAVAQENKFDSALDWIESLSWDGVERISTFLPRYFKSEDNPYTRAVSRYVWSALAGRLVWPGCQADMAAVLIGKQGARKTTGVKAIAPFKEWFVEISLMDRDDDLSRRLRGRVVGEIAELRGLGTRDSDSIKAFITRTHEDWIPKYKEFATDFPRRLVFIGTTNQNEFLDDETGNRRWLPVIVGSYGQVDVDALDRDRLQLWAEARAMLSLTGVNWHDAERLAVAVHSEHTVSDSWEDAVKLWLDSPALDIGLGSDDSTPNSARPFSMLDILKGVIGGDNVGRITRRDELRVGKILRAMGFEKISFWKEGKCTKRWVKNSELISLPFSYPSFPS